MYKHVQTYSGEMILTRCTVDVLLCCVGSVRFLAMSQAAAAATGTKPVSTYFVAKTKKTGATQTGTDATAAVPMEVDDVAVTSTAPASSGSVGGNGREQSFRRVFLPKPSTPSLRWAGFAWLLTLPYPDDEHVLG